MRRSVLLALAVLLGPLAASAQDPDAADRAWRDGDTATAERLYAAILAADSTHYAALHRMALLRAWAEDYDASLALFDRMLRLYPEATDARIDRARVLAWRGDLDRAIAALQDVLEAEPDNAAALEALGQFQSWAGRYDEAIRAYSLLERVDPGSLAAPLGIARAAAWSGDLEEAEARYRAALALDPDDVETLVGLSRTLRWQGRTADARSAARRALAADPTSAVARDEWRAVEVAFRPLASPALAHESDTDGNRMTTVSTYVRLRPLDRLSVRADAYTRDAREEGPADLDHAAHGGTITGILELGVGWGVAGTVGASVADADHGTVPAFALALSTPGREAVRATATVRRQAFDATARLIERGVIMTDATIEASTRFGERTDLGVAGGLAWFEGEVSGEENRRWSAYASASRRVMTPLTVALTVRGFGYRRDLDDGYFDPDFFGLAEILGRLTRPAGPLVLSLEGAPGLQQVGADGDARLVGRVAGSVTWPIGPARELALGALYANAGLGRLSASEDVEYAYRAFTARLTWAF